MEQLISLVCKLELTVCHYCDWLLLPGPHYAEGEGEEVVIDLEEEDDKDGFEYQTKAPLMASYTTLPSTGGHSEPSPHSLRSPTPEGTDPETDVALQTVEIKAHVEAFLAEANEDLELEDLPPLENVTPFPIHVPTIPGFVPIAMSTGQCCILSKGLPRAYHPYQNSVG